MKKSINQKRVTKIGLVTALLLASVFGLTSLSSLDANNQTEIRLRNAARVSQTSAFAIKDALASNPTQEPENPGESIDCKAGGSECTVSYNENQTKTVKGYKEP